LSRKLHTRRDPPREQQQETKMSVSARDVLDLLSRYLEVTPIDFDPDLQVDGASVGPSKGCLYFIKNPSAIPGEEASDQGLALVLNGLEGAVAGSKLVTAHPRRAFGIAVRAFFDVSSPRPGVHPSAVVEDGAEVDPSVSIGPNCFVGSGCSIGAHTSIGANTVIHSGVRIGAHCVIRSNSVIGGAGFGVEEYGDFETMRLPHIGGVIIGDHVEIGNMNAVDAGTINPTVIEDFVQTDNLVHIAHNCRIGKGALLTACAELSGSVTLGRGAYIGPNSAVMNGIALGERTLVGLGAVVRKSTEPNSVMAGNPARKIRER
jgi:UDP-3-O-[3-hydroxymyristoyl] glucosamine N-acyltransferase